MVKSYKGVQVEQKKTPQQILVKDYMTQNLFTFKQTDTIDQVVHTLLKENISGGPVVDEDYRLIGIISEGDCLKEVVKGKYTNSPNLRGLVKDHMVKEVITISPEETILEAANKFLSEKVRRFPVMKDGKLLGQISQRDVMRAIESLNAETWGK